jgi:hypothetical protein
MTELAGRRMAAEIDGDFVVFLIGARFNNKLHLLRSMLDLGGRRGMKHMLDYLSERPEKGTACVRDGDPHDRVREGEYEAVYGNMPAHGLGKAGTAGAVRAGVERPRTTAFDGRLTVSPRCGRGFPAPPERQPRCRAGSRSRS